MVHDDDLRREVVRLLGRVVLRVGRDEAALELLDRHVLDVEADVVARAGLGQRLVVHLDGLDLGGQARGREDDDHAGLDHARLHAADRDRADAADLVDVLERQAQRLVRGPLGRVDRVERLEQGRALVPGQVGRALDHVVALEARDGHEGDLLRVVADLLDVGGDLLDDLVVALLVVPVLIKWEGDGREGGMERKKIGV